MPSVCTEFGMKVTATPAPGFSLLQLHLYVRQKEDSKPVAPLTNSEMLHFSPGGFQPLLGATCATYLYSAVVCASGN